MDIEEPLFRREAIDYQRSFRGPGPLLAADARRNNTLFLVLLIMLAIGLAVSVLSQVEGEPLLSQIAPPLRGLLGSF